MDDSEKPASQTVGTPEYSEAEIRRIGQEIMAEGEKVKQGLLEGEFRNHTMLGGKYVHDDWDDKEYISTLYDDIFLKLVEQDHRPQTYTFDECLRECLQTLEWRRLDLKREVDMAIIDQRTYQNALALIEMAEGAIRKHQEQPERIRLIGV